MDTPQKKIPAALKQPGPKFNLTNRF